MDRLEGGLLSANKLPQSIKQNRKELDFLKWWSAAIRNVTENFFFPSKVFYFIDPCWEKNERKLFFSKNIVSYFWLPKARRESRIVGECPKAI